MIYQPSDSHDASCHYVSIEESMHIQDWQVVKRRSSKHNT